MSTDTASPPERLRKPNDHHAEWLFRKIWDRVNRKNMHFMGCLVGGEGSGKSFTAMRIAGEVDPTFSSDRVIFDVVDLLKTLRDGEHDPGNFYVLDEAGVQLGRRTWHERGQVLANQALQIIRDENLGLVFTLPRLGELDSQAQGRLQAVYEIIEKREDEHVRGKWKWMDPDRMDQTGEIYKKFPRRRMDGKVLRLVEFSFKPPGEELVAPYLERKQAFQQRVYDKTISELEGDEGGDEPETVGPLDVLEELESGADLEPVVSFNGNTGEPYIDAEMIELEYNLSRRDARKAKKLAEKSEEVDISDLSLTNPG